MKKKYYIAITIFILIVFGISFIPVVYCSFFNYATGDDFHYSALTHQVVVNHGSLIDFVKASFAGVKDFYNGWGGNWSAALLWTIQPAVWGESAYHTTMYISVAFMLASAWYLGLYWYKKYINKSLKGTDKCLFISIFALYAFVCFQGMPVGRTAFFWWSVIVNYIVPYAVMLLCIVWLDKFTECGKVSYIVYSTIAMIFIGGAGYMTIVVALEILVLYIAFNIWKKNGIKKIFGIIIPTAGFLISFLFNFKSPGNAARGGDALDFGIANLIGAVAKSIARGTTTAVGYFGYCRLLFIYVPVVFLLAYELIGVARNYDENETDEFQYKLPGVFIIITYLMYCSSFAPMVFMDDIVASSGHTNTYWLLFMIWLTISITYFVGYLKRVNADLLAKLIKPYRAAVLCLAVLSLIMFRHFIGNTFAYKCYEFYESGQLADYEAQMQERFALLNDSNVTDVELPQMNDEQGPFLHFASTEDPDNYTNRVTAAFYGKNSVRGVDRSTFYEKHPTDNPVW